jgi:hypothetical protein
MRTSAKVNPTIPVAPTIFVTPSHFGMPSSVVSVNETPS